MGAVEPIASQWEQLAVRVSARPFQYPGWTRAWIDAFAVGRVNICAAWRDARLVGVLPLMTNERCATAAANDQTPVFGPLAVDAAAATALVAGVADMRPHELDLRYVDPADTATAATTAALRAQGYRPYVRQTLRAPFVRIEGDWDTFAARFSKNRRKGMRRTQRRLAEQGKLRLDVQDGSEQLEALLEEGFALEASGWKRAQGTAVPVRPAHRRFYSEMARWAADRGWLRLLFLRLGDRPIAFELILVVDDVLYDLKGGYDEKLQRWAPGIMLMGEIVRYAVARDVRMVDWCGTDEPYKLEWSDGTHERVTATWFAPSPRGVVEYYGRTAVRSAEKQMRRLLRDTLPDGLVTRLRGARRTVR